MRHVCWRCWCWFRAVNYAPMWRDSSPQTTDIDTSRWVCSLCIYPLGWFGTLDFGAAYVTDSSPKFGDYRGLDEKGGYLALDGDTHYRDQLGRYIDLYARNLALDSRQIEMRGGRQGRYALRLGYIEIPKYRGYRYADALPGRWQRSFDSAGGLGEVACDGRYVQS